MRIVILVEEKGWRKVLLETVTRLEEQGHEVSLYKTYDVDAVIPFDVMESNLYGTDEDDKKVRRLMNDGD